MILKYKNKGYSTYIRLPFKMGAFFTIFMVPFSLITDVHAFPDNLIADVFALGGTYFICGFLTMWLSTEYQFRSRKDPYIFQGYFPLDFSNLTFEKAISILKELGYQELRTVGKTTTLQRGVWPGTSFTESPLDFRLHLVDVEEVQSELHLKFYDPKVEHQFDGRQIAYKAAQEFLLRAYPKN